MRRDVATDWRLHVLHTVHRALLAAQMVKNLPAVEEIRVQPLGQEHLMEKGMATCSSILAWRIPWTEEPNRLQSIGSDMTEQLTLYLHYIK